MENEDIQTEILLRMPLKSLMRCISVSKRWASIIRGKDFRKRYMRRSMTRPRVLFAFSRKSLDTVKEVMFHSVYQQEEPFSSSGQQQMRISPMHYLSASPIGGLVCHTSKDNVTLYNPGTREVKTLPEFHDDRGAHITRTYLGYDEGNDVYKVLCTTNILLGEPIQTEAYHVLTVGSKSWRPIICKHRHYPSTTSLCIDGVLYYAASRGRESIVIRFNVMSEEFSTIELPQGFKFSMRADLVNYYGEIAIVNKQVKGNGEFWILVRNEILGEWREEHVLIPCWTETVGLMRFSLVGTIGKTGELVFAQTWLHEGSHSVLYYHKGKQSLRKFPVEGVVDDSFYSVRTFLNHIDTPSIPI